MRSPVISGATITPSTLPFGGGFVQINATVRNASQIQLDVTTPGTFVNVSLPKTVSATVSRQFTIKASGSGKTTTASLSVTVDKAPPPPPPPSNLYPPIGYLDSVISGWAADQDTPTSPVSVVIAIDGVDIETTQTNVSRPDVQSAYSWAGPNTGFICDVPIIYNDGKDHVVSAYALDGTSRVPLNNSPRTYNSGGPPPPPLGTGPFIADGVAYSTLQAAHDALTGNTITVRAGVHSGVDPRCVIQKNCTIASDTPGQMAVFDISANTKAWIANGGDGGCLVVGENCIALTIDGLDVTGYQAPNQSNNAFIFVKSGYPGNKTPYVLNVKNCAIRKWTNGIICGPNTLGKIVTTNNIIEDCMGGDGKSHGMYISAIAEYESHGDIFRTTVGGVSGTLGHLFKSRAKKTTLVGSTFDGKGGCSRPLDICNGGILSVTDCTLHKYDDGTAGQGLRFGAEQRPGDPDYLNDGRTHSVSILRDRILNDRPTDEIFHFDAVTAPDGSVITYPIAIESNALAGMDAAKIIAAYPNNAIAKPDIAPTDQTAPSWSPTLVNQWTAIPGSRPADYLKNDGTGILPAANSAGGGCQEANYRQCDSYGGPCWSEKNKELYRFGGGHAATNMNPLVKAQLNLNSAKWVARDPGSASTTISADWMSGTWDASAYHSDGRPKSTHAYRGNHYLDSIDEFLQVACGAGNSVTSGHLDLPDVAGFANGSWRPKGYWSSLPVEGQGYTETVQCTDPNGNGVYLINLGNPLRRLDAATRQFTQIGANGHSWMGGNSDCTKMGAKAGQICAITLVGDTSVPYSLRYIDTATGAETAIGLTGDAFPLRVNGWRPVEMVWADTKWYVAFNQDDGNFGSAPWPLYSITPTSASSATVALVSVTGSPPTSGVRRGLYYSPGWKCLIAYDGWANPVKALKV